MINKVVCTHFLASLFTSRTTQIASLFGLYWSSSISVWSKIVSRRSSIPCPVIALHGTIIVSPPRSSGVSQFSESCHFISSILLFHRSTFVIATIIGTQASFAWRIASTVCGFTPSSAATTMTTIFVIFDPLALSELNKACPGVSIKVIFWSSWTTWEAQIDWVIPHASHQTISVFLR